MTELAPRICKACREPKPLTEYKVRKCKDGTYRLRTCDECQKEADRVRARKYVEKNREEVRARGAVDKYIRYHADPEFREKVKDSARESSQRYYEKNREAILARRKARRRARAAPLDQIEVSDLTLLE